MAGTGRYDFGLLGPGNAARNQQGKNEYSDAHGVTPLRRQYIPSKNSSQSIAHQPERNRRARRVPAFDIPVFRPELELVVDGDTADVSVG